MENTHILFTKSEENLNGADILIQYEHFTISVHCAYYACYQIVMLITKDKMTQNEINNSSSHKNTIEKLIWYLKDKGCSDESTRKIKERLMYLKKCRTLADYDNHFFDADDAKKIYFCAKSLKKLLEKIYRNL